MRKKGMTVWFTGLPCSGKTTISKCLESLLSNEGIAVERIDGDTFRSTISKDLGFSKEDRDKNIERVVYVSEMLTKHGIIVLASFVSPYAEKRLWARQYIGSFMEVYVRCPIAVCEKRDVKGLYALARQGKIPDFTGISDPYEVPVNPELIINSERESVDISARKCLNKLYGIGVIEDIAGFNKRK